MNWVETMVQNAAAHVNPAYTTQRAREGRQLEEFRHFNFRSMPTELRAVFPKTHDRIRLRYSGLTARVCVDGAGQYVAPVMRVFEGATEIESQLLDDIYDELDVDSVLLDAEQSGVAQQAYLLTLLPVRDGSLRLTRFLPFQVLEVTITDPLRQDDLSAADRIVFAVPLQSPTARGLTDDTGGSAALWCAHLVLSREQAYLRLPDGQEIGIYADSKENPLGFVPVVGTRRARSADGIGWLPTIAQDVLSCQIGLVLALSDVEYIVRKQSHVKVLVTGEEVDKLPAEIEDRPDGMIPLPEGTTATGLTLQPPIEKYLRAVETSIYYLSVFRYLRPDPYEASIVTGSARREEAAGFHEDRKRQERRCMRLERDLLRLIIATYNAALPRALKISSTIRMRVEFFYVETPQNVLQKAQALSVLMAEGLADRVREIAREERVSESEARVVLRRRLEDQAAFLAAKAGTAGAPRTPGLDKLAPEVPDAVDQDGDLASSGEEAGS